MAGSAERSSTADGGPEGGAGVPIIALRGGVTMGGSEPLEGRGFAGPSGWEPRPEAEASWGVNAVGVDVEMKLTGGPAVAARSPVRSSSGMWTMFVFWASASPSTSKSRSTRSASFRLCSTVRLPRTLVPPVSAVTFVPRSRLRGCPRRTKRRPAWPSRTVPEPGDHRRQRRSLRGSSCRTPGSS